RGQAAERDLLGCGEAVRNALPQTSPRPHRFRRQLVDACRCREPPGASSVQRVLSGRDTERGRAAREGRAAPAGQRERGSVGRSRLSAATPSRNMAAVSASGTPLAARPMLPIMDCPSVTSRADPPDYFSGSSLTLVFPALTKSSSWAAFRVT